MPNWVTNDVEFRVKKGNEAKLLKVINKYLDENKEFDFEKLIPSPRRKEDCPEAFIIEDGAESHIVEDGDRPWFNWYNWNVNFWGTKWNACHTTKLWHDGEVQSIRIGKELYSTLGLSFDTAWSDPRLIIEKLVDELDEMGDVWMKWIFFEESLEYCGRVEYDFINKKWIGEEFTEREDMRRFSKQEDLGLFDWEDDEEEPEEETEEKEEK